ncbi:MAG: phage minor head protein [Alphaproteobacteria bacterium]|nr:phage minor head protein [Alphaproteobacteria bacterium]
MPLPDIIHTPAYRQAFNLYLRKGVPIELSLKAAAQEHPTTHYIWRTRGDNKVRASHAANNGKVFAWDNPPLVGHPGEDYNCRCTAEPYVHGESEFAYQALTSEVNDSSPKWKKQDFVAHAFKGGGDVTLSGIGHLQDIINHYAYHLGEAGIFEAVNRQVIDAARAVGNGYFPHPFSNSYDFTAVSYPHGGSTVFGIFKGYVSEKNGLMKIDGTVEYFFDDAYTDPVRIRDRLLFGTSDPGEAAEILRRITEDIRQYLRETSDADSVPEILRRITAIIAQYLPATPSVEAVSEILRFITDGGGKVYAITGQWQTELHAEAKRNRNESRYKWNKDA